MSTHTHPPAFLLLLFPYLLTFLRKSLHLALVLPKYAITFLTTLSHSAIITPLTYILAPFFTFAAVFFSITLGTPWKFLVWLLEALFPLYVFCGVACITGALVGFGGRVVCLSIARTLREEREGQQKGYNEEGSKSMDLDPDARSAKRRRLEREVKFKYEESDE
jgi:hypothetical protein